MPHEAWGAKREREYEHLKEEFAKEGRYPGRERQVAAAIVNKQRAEQSETIVAKEEDIEGSSPDAGLPVKAYDHKTVEQIGDQVEHLDRDDLKKLKTYEQDHRDRKGVIDEIDQELQ